MPLWIIAAVLVLYGMGYIVFAFTPPPMFLDVAFMVPPIVPSNPTAMRIARVVIGAVLMIVPLVGAYMIMRM
jgi:hypothetical protein